MHLAAGNAFLYGVEQLLKAGAESNAQDTFGNTPLHYAYENSEMGIVELLLARGADSYLRNDDGMSAKELYPEGE